MKKGFLTNHNNNHNNNHTHNNNNIINYDSNDFQMIILDRLYDELFITNTSTNSNNNAGAIYDKCEVLFIHIIEIGLILDLLTLCDIVAFLSTSKKLYTSKSITPSLIESAIMRGIGNNKTDNITRSSYITLKSPLFPWSLRSMRAVYYLFKSIPCCFKLRSPLIPIVSAITAEYPLPIITKADNQNQTHYIVSSEPQTLVISISIKDTDGTIREISYSFQAFPIGYNQDTEGSSSDEQDIEIGHSLTNENTYENNENLDCIIQSDNIHDDNVDDNDFCLESDLCESCYRYLCSKCLDLTFCDACEEIVCSSCRVCNICDCCETSQCSNCTDFFTCGNAACAKKCCTTCNDDEMFMNVCEICHENLCQICMENGLISFCESCESMKCQNCMEVDFCELCGQSICEMCRSVKTCDSCQRTFCVDCTDFTSCESCEKIFCDECYHVQSQNNKFFVGHCDLCHETNCFSCRPFFQCKICRRVSCIQCNVASICSVCTNVICTECELMSICLNPICKMKICSECRLDAQACRCCDAPMIIIPEHVKCRQS